MTLPSSTSAMTHRRSYPQHREPRIRRLTVADSLGRDDFGEEKTSLEQALARKTWHERLGTKGLARKAWHERLGTKGLARKAWHERLGTKGLAQKKRALSGTR